MAKLSDEQRRALRILTRSPNGCTEEIMLAYGFKLDFLGDLVFGGLALATPQDTRAGGKPMMVVWMTITAAGRKAIAE
jgi:hypothetical protein